MPSVLLIEDSEDLRKMYTFGLQYAGFDITTAQTIDIALEKVKERTYDVVILDMMLPGRSGLDFLTAYNVKAMSPKTKLVVFSGIERPSVIESFQQYKIDGYLVKSEYDPSALADYIRGLLAELPKEPTA